MIMYTKMLETEKKIKFGENGSGRGNQDFCLPAVETFDFCDRNYPGYVHWADKLLDLEILRR